jgi:hypothetical protein
LHRRHGSIDLGRAKSGRFIAIQVARVFEIFEIIDSELPFFRGQPELKMD